jgi:hypothetical protein
VAFRDAIRNATVEEKISSYTLAVARVRGDRIVWERHQRFIDALDGNPIRIITFQEMVSEIYDQLGTTLAATLRLRPRGRYTNRSDGLECPGQ